MREPGLRPLIARMLEGSPTFRIAHEFEHALEVREGQNLPRLARSGCGAWTSTYRVVETLRATKVGRAVQVEIRASRPPGNPLK